MHLRDRQRLFALATMFAAILAAPSAWAHAHLDGSAPAAQSVGASPSAITLHFTEALEAKFSGFEITDARGAKVNVKSKADPANAALLVAPLSTPLAAGPYQVSWHIVAKDGHRMQGSYSFTVK